MEDLIACLYPFEDTNGKARKVIKDPANSPEDCPRCVDVTRQSPKLQGRQSRETTAPPDDNYHKKVQPQDRDPRLELRFSHKLKGGLCIVFRTNRNSCDIVLPHLTGIRDTPFFRVMGRKPSVAHIPNFTRKRTVSTNILHPSPATLESNRMQLVKQRRRAERRNQATRPEFWLLLVLEVWLPAV
ncbi:hypothetical protein M011DRAFT_472947 [Sporormia fimetaria CBS 119925]|uniref:Uncharacterized protein n=1 Tax=Sporormia fimetaria CBS 119925 TaxID=1340428 RepID=A0A6A6UTD9_9PLEO|nr:hypothetical protein M011DRAFT_472947 [Sporormia fimetaria CBS 119925]